jgi:hypothetical protein
LKFPGISDLWLLHCGKTDRPILQIPPESGKILQKYVDDSPKEQLN